MNKRNIRIVNIGMGIVRILCSNGKKTFVVSGLPEDAEVVSVNFTYDRQAFDVIIRSDTFSPVRECDLIPRFDFNVDVTQLMLPNGTMRAIPPEAIVHVCCKSL